ncbi:MAG: hypothetical protein LBL16_03405 [Endomicrobium sp.]|nr:hypothetical protein [Endomicrobium sp.]
MKKQGYFVLFVILTFISFSCRQSSNRIGVNRLILTEFVTRLQAAGRPEDEIRGFMQLEQEDEYLNDEIGEVVLDSAHYVYRVRGRNYDGHQTLNACGIWAVRRKLRHMRHLGRYGIEENAWYVDSDKQIRAILSLIPEMPQEERPLIEGNGFIYHCAIVRLQIYYGIAPENTEVRGYNVKNAAYHGNVFSEALYVYDPAYLEWSKTSDYGYQRNRSPDINDHGFTYNFEMLESLGCRVMYRD